MVTAQLDDIRRQADVVAFDYERMMREAKAANIDLDVAHVIAEHLALYAGARTGSSFSNCIHTIHSAPRSSLHRLGLGFSMPECPLLACPRAVERVTAFRCE
jgi:hypothetical protein